MDNRFDHHTRRVTIPTLCKKAISVAFEKVRRSGLTNMFDARAVREITQKEFDQILTDRDCFDCMPNYDKYFRKYAELKIGKGESGEGI